VGVHKRFVRIDFVDRANEIEEPNGLPISTDDSPFLGEAITRDIRNGKIQNFS
jgi:hypothetical protein